MTPLKTHVALNVSNLKSSVAFYKVLFETEPVKHKTGYAKFEVDSPALNLTLNEYDAENDLLRDRTPHSSNLSHLGIQVQSTAAVMRAIARLTKAGLTPTAELNTDCCYALQDKAWVHDPDGTPWEIFVVHIPDTAPALELDNTPQSTDTAASRSCCAPTCCA